MALLSKETHYDYSGREVKASVELFDKANRRISDKQKAIDDLQNELGLLEEQALKLYKNQVQYIFAVIGGPDDLRKWLEMQETGLDSEGNKLDKRRKYKEKSRAEYFVSKLKEFFDVDDLEPTEVIDYNFGVANEIEFKSHGKKWMLQIPVVDRIDLREFRDSGARAFKLQLYFIEDHCWNSVGDTFEEEELAELMQKGIKKYCN